MAAVRSTLAERVKAYLAERGGSVESETGRGITAPLAEAVGTDLGVLNGVLARMEKAGSLSREVRGRRTYRLALVDPAIPRAPKRAPTPASAARPSPARPGLGRRVPVRARAHAGNGAPAASATIAALEELRRDLTRQTESLTMLHEVVSGLTRRLATLEAAGRDAGAGGGFLRRRR